MEPSKPAVVWAVVTLALFALAILNTIRGNAVIAIALFVSCICCAAQAQNR